MQLKAAQKIISFLFLFFCIAILPASTYDLDPDSKSLILNEINFKEAVHENPYLLVNFYALWCRYSKKLKLEWVALAKSLEDEKSPIKLAMVEAYDEKNLALQNNIEGFPTIKLFIKGNEHLYTGERLQSNLLEFLHRKTKSPLSIVKDNSVVSRKLNEYEWIGLFFGNPTNPIVLDVAYEINDVLFISVDNSFKARYGNPQNDGFVLMNNVTVSYDVFSGELNQENLKQFINNKKFPPVAKFGKATAERVFLSEAPSIILLKKSNNDGKKAEEEFKAASASLGKVVFMSIANYEDNIGRLLADNIGVEESELPTVRIIRADKERIRKYYLDKAIKKDNIIAFYQDFLKQEAKRSYLSEKAPVEDHDMVKKVVTKNFESLVLNPSKDVLVMFWVPWCGHCRAMMPVYDNVGRKTREVENFVVAKMDVSVNDIEGFGLDIVEYPTILLFKANDKKNPVEFQGDRTEYVFNDFIRSHASVSLSKMKGPNPFDKNEL